MSKITGAIALLAGDVSISTPPDCEKSACLMRLGCYVEPCTVNNGQYKELRRIWLSEHRWREATTQEVEMFALLMERQ